MWRRSLFSEINPLYASGKGHPNISRLRLRMDAPVDAAVLRHAVAVAMERYPYFRVRLVREGGHYLLEENPKPVVVCKSPEGVDLASAASNEHLVAFSACDDWLSMDIFHAMTDGTGAMELARTVLYYYCTERYGVSLSSAGIRLAGELIPVAEWDDPARAVTALPGPDGDPAAEGLNLIREIGPEGDRTTTLHALVLDEEEFMRFSRTHDGSPATITALLLSRAIASVYPDVHAPIRISVCLNQREALRAPLAHQSLVGGAWLEYQERMRDWPLERQATAFRGMVFAQSREESVLEGLKHINRNARELIGLRTDGERLAATGRNARALKQLLTATVSYVGRARLGDAERYVQEAHLVANALFEEMLIEVMSIKGKFFLDISQNFASSVIADAFIKQLEENGIRYEDQGRGSLVLPKVCLPWNP